MSIVGAFRKGLRLWVDDRPATILSAENPGAALVAFDGAPEPETVNLLTHYAAGAVRWDPPKVAPDATPPTSLANVSESAWDEARRREKIVAEVCASVDVEKAVRAACEAHKVSRATVYRWKRDFERGGLRALLPEFSSRGGRGKHRLAPERESLLDELIRREYLRRTRPTLRHAYEVLCAEFLSQKVQPPALRTVRARIRALDLVKTASSREGTKKSRRHSVSQGKFPGEMRPLHTIMIDHSPLDLQIVDSVDRTRVIGRPFLTLALDVATRMVFGYYLSLDPPSYLSVAMCILQGVLPKDEVIARYELAQPWPIHGLPEFVHTDNGKDFRSKGMERFAAQYEITLEYRPVRTPNYGGNIERVIGTVNRYTHALPGTTKSSVADRGDYDAEAAATYTIEECEEFIARRIVEHYNTSVHSELLKSPLTAWNEAMAAGTFSPTLPSNPAQFRIDLLPYEERTIQKDGVAIFGLHYTDGALQTWRSRSGTDAAQAKYVVKYDPRDLSRVYFIPPEGGQPLTVPLANRSLGSLSLLELRRTQALAKEERRAWSERILPEMLARERAQRAEVEKKSKAAKRDSARVRRAREATVAEPSLRDASTTPATASTAPSPVVPSESHVSNVVEDDGWGAPTLRFRGDA